MVMVTVSERLPALNRFLRTLADHEPGRAIFCYVQGEDVRDRIEFPSGIEHEAAYEKERIGCHAARIRALRMISGFDSYVNVDDDVELLPETKWQPAIEKAMEPGVGFVLTNWVRSESLLDKSRERIREEFIPQAMVYQGGGMAYGEDVADLMRYLPDVPARYDDLWPLTAYLEGYRNYRYRGSLALHRIMGKGGMQTYMKAEPRPLLAGEWVNYPYLPGQPVGSDYGIPMDKDLKQKAKDRHKEMREKRGWK